MKLNQNGVDLIKRFEACSLKAYPDPVTKGPPYTICYGHTGSNVQPNSIWTQALCDQTLQSDLNKIVSQLTPLIHVDLNDNEFSAVVSLVFNIGIGNFKNSTMLKLLNAAATMAAANEFTKWDHAGGREIPGLLKRRLAEQKLFNS